jgi:hypothetical protein
MASTPCRRDGVGVRRRLDDALAETALEVTVRVEPEIRELGRARHGPGPPRRLDEVRQRRRELAVGWQRHLIDVGLGARDRLMVEQRESRCDLFHLVVERVAGDRSVDITVLLRPRAVEVVRDKEDLERTAAPDQSRKAGHRPAARHETGADFELAQDSGLT